MTQIYVFFTKEIYIKWQMIFPMNKDAQFNRINGDKI